MTPVQGFVALSCYALAAGLAVISAVAWPRKDKP